MSDESDFKKQVWVLENEKKGLMQQVERLENRLKEYITWSEQAQRILEENKSKIATLEQQNKILSERVNQGTVAMSNNLLDENSQMKRKLQDLEEQFTSLNELLNPLVMSNILDINQKLKKQLISVFSKADNEKKIISLFLEDPSNQLTLTQISNAIKISQSDCSIILKKFVSEDFIRETGNGVFRTVAAVGDKIVSTKDYSRVSTEALHSYIIEQLSSTIDSKQHLAYLDDYASELQKRGETSLAQKIINIQGELHMAKRPSDWIVDQINMAIDQQASVPLTSRTSQHLARTTSSRSTPYTSSYTTPDISSRTQFLHPHNQQTTQLITIDTKDWTKLSNADVIDNLKLQISDKMDYLAVIEGLGALRDHLSSSVSGRALYQINTLINQIKNKKSFDKNEVHNTLVDLMTKV